MDTTIQTLTPMINARKILELARALPPVELQWLADQVSQLADDDFLTGKVTVDEAIEYYLADKCSLGRAAELAGVTRWDIMDILYERGIPTNGGHDLTVEEYETMFDRMEGRYGNCQ